MFEETISRASTFGLTQCLIPTLCRHSEAVGMISLLILYLEIWLINSKEHITNSQWTENGTDPTTIVDAVC